MTTRKIITGVSLLLFSCLASAEMWWERGEKNMKLPIDTKYSVDPRYDYTPLVSQTVQNVQPGEEYTVICDGSFSNLTGQTVTLSSKITAVTYNGYVTETILPAQPLYFTAERLREGINRTGMWLAFSGHQGEIIFQCEYRATSVRWDGSKSRINVSNAAIFVQRRAP